MTVTREEVRLTCEALIDAHPGAANTKTMNWNEDGTPCCIAGHVYDLLDVDIERDIEGSVGALAEETPFFLDWDDDAIELLNRVQSFADEGFHSPTDSSYPDYLVPGPIVVSWREALDRALSDEQVED